MMDDHQSDEERADTPISEKGFVELEVCEKKHPHIFDNMSRVRLPEGLKYDSITKVVKEAEDGSHHVSHIIRYIKSKVCKL
jgi:hypothetical protein